MIFPETRMRRLRYHPGVRNLTREYQLSADDLIMPLFVGEDLNRPEPIASMPGCMRHSLKSLIEECRILWDSGIQGLILFGIPGTKDAEGSQASCDNGVIQNAVRAIKKAVPNLLIITDVCLCEYTSHGHCGLIDSGNILNDPTLELLSRVALSHAEAGADMVAPSDMMDGRVGSIRAALDDNGHHKIPIMAYSAKYASAFYGPFREAAGSAPQFGDRKSYQMDPANSREALREIELDIAEGADIIMVKPALAFMDIINMARQSMNLPLAVYNVSGEYAMVKAAALNGWIDEQRVVLEMLTGFKRAGADIILTYHALDVVRWLNKS